ncbi:hypothetical protein RB597_005098 [Gaeumannomyces tritici]
MDTKAVVIAKSILSDEAKRELLGVEKNPSLRHIQSSIMCWYDPKNLGHGLRSAPSETADNSPRDGRSHPDKSEPPRLLSDEMREWIRFGLGEDIDFKLECKVARHLLAVSQRHVPGPGDPEVWGEVRLVQEGSLKTKLETKLDGSIPPPSLFYPTMHPCLNPCDMGMEIGDAFFYLARSISVLSGGATQVSWESLHCSVKDKLKEYSDQAENHWDAGYKPHLARAFIWHALEDHFFSSTPKDKDMFSSPLWVADNLLFEAIKEEYQAWCAEAREEFEQVLASHDDRNILREKERCKRVGDALQAQHRTWRAIGGRMITRIDAGRLSQDYIKKFVKKELEHLVNFESPRLIGHKDDTYDLCPLDALAMRLCQFDHQRRIDVKDHYLVWNLEDILATPDDPLQSPVRRSRNVYGFRWVTKPPYRQSPDAEFIQFLPDEVIAGLQDRMARMGAEHVRCPVAMPVVSLVEQPMLVAHGPAWNFRFPRGFDVVYPMVIKRMPGDVDKAMKALADDKAEWEAKLKA